jgi:hypothetical protein
MKIEIDGKKNFDSKTFFKTSLEGATTFARTIVDQMPDVIKLFGCKLFIILFF